MKKTALTAAILLALTAFATKQTPDMRAKGSWQSIGKINDSNIEVSYDTGSISRQGSEAYIRDRKTVSSPSKESYRDTVEYKTVISRWAFQCPAQTFRITEAQFFDHKGKTLAKQQYTAQTAPAQRIMPDTPAQTLAGLACKTR